MTAIELACLVLGLALLGAIVIGVWLALQRSKLAAALDGERDARELAQRLAEEHRGAAERERASGEARASELQQRLDAQIREVVRLNGTVERLGAEVQAAHQREDAAVDAAQATFEEKLHGERKAMAAREQALAEQRAELEKRIKELSTETTRVFESLSATALRTASDEFLKRAEAKLSAQQQMGIADLEKRKDAVDALVKPLGETLAATRSKLDQMEKERAETLGRLSAEIRQVADMSTALRTETGKLTQALKRPEIRGRYGEIQLARVAELAGMKQYCDFATQSSSRDSDGKLLRPDLIVKLPNDRQIVVDAKTNISAYLDAIDAGNKERIEQLLQKFADDVKAQVLALSKKQYWKQYDGSPDFVVMFIPGDQFIDAAMQRHPDLIEIAAINSVILASPSTLIGLLRAVDVGWRQRQFENRARELMDEGKTLHERASKVWELLAKLGQTLGRGVEQYNDLLGSVERRLTPTLRKFEQSGASSGKELTELPEITVTVRGIPAGSGTSGASSVATTSPVRQLPAMLPGIGAADQSSPES
jgi:DNA recombination protein RmuC